MKHIVYCDLESAYGNALSQHIEKQIRQRNLTASVQISFFNEVTALETLLQIMEPDVLLLDGDIPLDQRKRWKAGRKVILSRDKQSALAPEEEPQDKYQRSDVLMEKILREETFSFTKKDMKTEQAEVIAVYSPIHRIGKTTFALTMAQSLARQKRLLYLNFDPFSKHLFPFHKEENAKTSKTSHWERDVKPGQTRKSLSDLLFLMEDVNENVGLAISMMTSSMDQVEYLMPMEYMQDLLSVKASRWKQMIEVIRAQCIFDTIILDLCDGVQGLYDILLNATRVYTPVLDDVASQEKLRLYQSNLIDTGYEEVLSISTKQLMQATG